MRQIITLNNQKVEYTVKTSCRARRLRVTINCAAAVVVTAPYFFPEGAIEKFLLLKSRWIMEKIASARELGPKNFLPGGARSFIKFREEAGALAAGILAKMRQRFNFSHNRIFIKNQRTRWGSCSRRGNLNFNYRIIFLPDGLAEYVVAHEICHLKEFNHSAAFWKLVGELIPDYRERRRNLRNYASCLDHRK